MDYVWKPIEDLDESARDSASPELATLRALWAEQREGLDETGSLQDFTQRLCRNWAIETGILERLYTLDRGVTTLLIEQGIDSALIPHNSTNRDPQFLAAILEDQRETVEGLFSFVRGGRKLSVSYTKELHQALTRHERTTTAVDSQGTMIQVELRRGEFKVHPNNPTRRDGSIHEYCPPEHVGSEMDRLIELHQNHVEQGVAPEVECAWLHHRFAQIHPFQDGNGRVARCLASLVMIQSEMFPVVIDRDHRVEYIESLEQADHGDLSSLIALVVREQKRALVGAIGLVREVGQATSVSAVIQGAREDLTARAREAREEMEAVKGIASSLLDRCRSRLKETANELEQAMAPILRTRAVVDGAAAGDERDHWFRYQVVETAQSLSYVADLQEHRAWARLAIRGEPQHEILISIHGLGRPFRGMLAASACYFRRETDAEGERESGTVVPLASEVFQFNYRDSEAEALQRLDSWLDGVLIRGLENWRRAL